MMPSIQKELPPTHYVESRQSLQALPPGAQTIIEIDAILKDPRLREYLRFQNIQMIRKTDSGYEIVTDTHTIQVDVKYFPLPEGMLGPDRFELVFSIQDAN